MTSKQYDVCIIGSGAGAGPVAYTLAMAGKKVIILEKGRMVSEKDFNKDEIGSCRRDLYTPHLQDEPQVIEDMLDGEWKRIPNSKSGWSFWNGNIVGGSSNFMSGYFHRAKEIDFRLKSEFGDIQGANIADWPIGYEEMEPYFDKVEKVIGVSGKVVKHKHQEMRSSSDFPFPPLVDHPFASWIDEACAEMDIESIPMPRAILSKPHQERNACSYSVYCGSYGCTTGAKGSSRAALIQQIMEMDNCEVCTEAMVYKLEHNDDNQIVTAHYYDREGNPQQVHAKTFVVAAQAIESARLLLNSKSDTFPNGLANNNGQVGKNLLFSSGGMGSGEFDKETLEKTKAKAMNVRGPFINRAVQHWYTFEHPELGYVKGGCIDFIHEHPNPILKANSLKWEDGKLLWGSALQEKVKKHFDNRRKISFEVFADWLPNDDCFVEIDPEVVDKWGIPVAKIRIGSHPHDLMIGNYLVDKAKEILLKMGAENVKGSASTSPPPNLQAGGCRFGNDPKSSVLNKDCRTHEIENLYVTDGSFMPTGGSVTYTWTIYANAFRVADILLNKV